jgi:hypothetical protein
VNQEYDSNKFSNKKLIMSYSADKNGHKVEYEIKLRGTRPA